MHRSTARCHKTIRKRLSPRTTSPMCIYTSGSTGKPKGVMVEHREHARLLRAMRDGTASSADDVWPLFHSSPSISRSGSCGARCCRRAAGGRARAQARSRADSCALLLARARHASCKQTPSDFRAADRWRSGTSAAATWLRHVILRRRGACLPAWWRGSGDKVKSLWNLYGPTETTAGLRDLSDRTRRERVAATVPVGRPIARYAACTCSMRNINWCLLVR